MGAVGHEIFRVFVTVVEAKVAQGVLGTREAVRGGRVAKDFVAFGINNPNIVAGDGNAFDDRRAIQAASGPGAQQRAMCVVYVNIPICIDTQTLSPANVLAAPRGAALAVVKS